MRITGIMATPGRGVAPEKTMKNAPLKDREACNDHLLPASLISQNGFTVLQELAPFPLSARRLPGFIGPVPPPTLDKSAAPYSHVIHIRIVWMARRQLFSTVSRTCIWDRISFRPNGRHRGDSNDRHDRRMQAGNGLQYGMQPGCSTKSAGMIETPDHDRQPIIHRRLW